MLDRTKFRFAPVFLVTWKQLQTIARGESIAIDVDNIEAYSKNDVVRLMTLKQASIYERLVSIDWILPSRYLGLLGREGVIHVKSIADVPEEFFPMM